MLVSSFGGGGTIGWTRRNPIRHIEYSDRPKKTKKNALRVKN